MSDDDNLLKTRVEAMRKLMQMGRTIDDDESGYYEPHISLDESLRNKHPSLKDAWEKYQSILTIYKQDLISKND